MTFDEWFRAEQGDAHATYYFFAQAAWRVAQSQERDACAKVCDELADNAWSKGEAKFGDIFAKAIRARAVQWGEDRMDIIGPNGNDGLHYDLEK
jgi:hypothetical protein